MVFFFGPIIISASDGVNLVSTYFWETITGFSTRLSCKYLSKAKTWTSLSDTPVPVPGVRTIINSFFHHY